MRDVLERAIAADFDDPAAHAAYADWLAEQGDPRGEFIQIQLALEDESRTAAERKRLRAREHELLLAHERVWLGPLAQFLLAPTEARLFGVRLWKRGRKPLMPYTWRRGWLDRLQLPFDPNWSILAALQVCPNARHLHHLFVPFSLQTAEEVASHPLPQNIFPNLRVFEFGEERDTKEPVWSLEFASAGDAVLPLVRAMPKIEELYVRARGVALRELFALPNLGNLRALQVYHVEEPYPLAVLAANPAFARLEKLWLHPSMYMAAEERIAGVGAADDLSSFLPLTEVRALFTSPYLTSLRLLQLRGSDLGDAGRAALIESAMLKRLKSLDLRFGRITDRGARLLAGCTDLRNLEALDLRNNQMTPDGARAILDALPHALCAPHDEPGSTVYMYSGDIE
jgi:uncharacterized protein (TIGR02996 family)